MIREAGWLIRSLMAVVIFSLLLATYNFFLLDTSIERIRLALGDVTQTQHLDEANSATIFLQDLLVSEIGREEVNLERLVASDAFKGIFESSSYDRKADAQFLLENLLSSYERNRSPALKWIDQFNQFFLDKLYDVVRFLKYIWSKVSADVSKSEEKSDDRQVAILSKARELELKWQFEKAAKAYELFIESFPDYPKINLVRLYLSSVYLRSGQLALADDVFSSINITLASPSELSLMQALKKKRGELAEIKVKRDLLWKNISEIQSNEQKADVATSEKPRSTLDRLKEKNLEQTPKSYVAQLFQLGLYDLYLFDLVSAKETFSKLLDLELSEEIEKQAKWIQGWILLLENNYQESRRLMRELFERYPKEKVGALSAFALATIAERSGDFQEAAREYEKLSRISDASMTSFLLKYRAGGVYLYQLHDLQRARDVFSEAKQLLPSGFLSDLFDSRVVPAIDATIRDAAFEKFFQGDIDGAYQLFQDMLTVNPNDAWANCGYGLILYIQGEKQKGIDYVSKCRSMKNDEYTASSLAYVNESENKVKEAQTLYQEAIHAKPSYVPALYNLARLQIQEGRYEQAEANLRTAKKEALRYDQYLQLIANNLGVVLSKRGNFQEAQREFEFAIKKNPDFSDARYNLDQLYQSNSKSQRVS